MIDGPLSSRLMATYIFCHFAARSHLAGLAFTCPPTCQYAASDLSFITLSDSFTRLGVASCITQSATRLQQKVRTKGTSRHPIIVSFCAEGPSDERNYNPSRAALEGRRSKRGIKKLQVAGKRRKEAGRLELSSAGSSGIRNQQLSPLSAAVWADMEQTTSAQHRSLTDVSSNSAHS
ncbi:hypothetical protein J6590_039150 [Homalodisca vitripennis]|nr:hypothetical protein J6590_039150 [Homalodisca vitripennis]